MKSKVYKVGNHMIKKRKNINEIVNESIEQCGEVKVKCLLQERCEERGLNLTELSNLTGIRYASLNDLKNGKKVTLNLQHTLAIMVSLRLKSFDDLFQLEFEDYNDSVKFEYDSFEYEKNGLPDSEYEKIKVNEKRLQEMKEQKNH
jgi:DNA-binding Xre family transcriptional regulator